ncbi:hypothetical protein ACWEP5_10585 [Nocardia niigatensis]
MRALMGDPIGMVAHPMVEALVKPEVATAVLRVGEAQARGLCGAVGMEVSLRPGDEVVERAYGECG